MLPRDADVVKNILETLLTAEESPIRLNKDTTEQTASDKEAVLVRRLSLSQLPMTLDMPQPEVFATSEVEKYLAHRLDLPFRPAWSKTQISLYLKSQNLVGGRRGTIANWETKLCYYIKDFRDRMPKDEHGQPITGGVFTQYQFSVIVRLAYAMTLLRPYCNGSEYLNLVQRTVKSHEIQRRYLSYAVWQYDQQDAA